MEKGDKVVLENDEQTPGDWAGMTGTISGEPTILGREEFARFQPDNDRPDGYGTEWFFWPTSLMKNADG